MSKTTVTLHWEDDSPIVSPNLHGHFAEHLGRCIYNGIWVGPDSPLPNDNGLRSDVVAALKKLAPPVLRWPGGCFADDYHWRDGIGPQAQRPRTVNIHWGETVEDNGFGTHEFVRLCRAIGATPYFAGNLGSGSPEELRDWVEYCNFAGDSTLADERRANGAAAPFDIRWWGVGNENWGCGGNFTPEDYATEYRRYATYLRSYHGKPLTLVACGPNGNDKSWTERFFRKFHDGYRPPLHAFAAHYYCGTTGTSATEFTEDEFYTLLQRSRYMETLICEQRALLDTFDPERKIQLIVDEWGTWHPVETGTPRPHLFQQNTMRDALVAALTLDIFHQHCDKVTMGNIAQTVNVLQAMVLTEADGPGFCVTPTYHVFDLYKAHRGGRRQTLQIRTETLGEGLPRLSGSATRHGDTLVLSLVHAHASEPLEVHVELPDVTVEVDTATARTLTGAIQAHNTFSQPAAVAPTENPQVHPTHLILPPCSVTVLTVRLRS